MDKNRDNKNLIESWGLSVCETYVKAPSQNLVHFVFLVNINQI